MSTDRKPIWEGGQSRREYLDALHAWEARTTEPLTAEAPEATPKPRKPRATKKAASK